MTLNFEKYMANAKLKCVFFDRDGIVNVSPGAGYVTRLEDFHLLPQIVECLHIVSARGYQAAVVTNQRGIARGIFSTAVLDDIHSRLRDELRQRGAPALLDIAYCPHQPGECNCRKPLPGMLLNLAARHNIDLAASWMVGDMETDVEAGRRAGCRTILVNPADAATEADYRVASMELLPDLLKKVL